MKIRHLVWVVSLFGLVMLAACSSIIPTIEDSFETVTLTPLTTAVPATLTPVPGGAAEVGNTFYKAWEAGDYLGMYSLLSPQSQALVDNTAFANRYQEAMQTATVQSVRTQPLAAEQMDNRATLVVDVMWETAVLGPISRKHTAELIFSNERWGIIWHEGLILPELKGGNQLVLDYRAPSRANIYDRNAKALAYQGSAIQLGVVPGQIQDEAGLLATLSPLLDKSPEELREAYASAELNWYVPLGQIPSSVMQENYAAIQPFINSGLTIDERLTRIYTDIAPHVVGYVGGIPPERAADYLSLGYQEDTRVGLSGVEAWGETYLSGTRGGILNVVDPNGRFIGTVAEAEPRQARSVYTTFDRDFQTAVEEALAEAIRSHPAGHAGAAVVMDVNSGDILAMASYPDYDPSIFDTTRPGGEDGLTALFNDSQRPLINRATQGEYPAGSTFKIVTYSAAVLSGLYNANTRYNSTGSWNRLGDQLVLTDWRTGGHGNISLRHALVVSCNTCFVTRRYTLNSADSDFFPKVASEFGFGSATGLIGAFESTGVVPGPEWKINTIGEGWVPGDAVIMGIGQGFLEVTPLQMARMTAAVANGGTLLRPKLIDRIGEGGGAPEEKLPVEVSGVLPVSAEQLAVIQQSMREVVMDNNGTASLPLAGLRVPTAGKTGTAQTPQTNPHAWFTGYAPAAPFTLTDGSVVNEPEIAVTVIIENAGEGSEVAAPVFRRIIELYYSVQPITAYPW